MHAPEGMLDQRFGDDVLLFVGCDANFVYHRHGFTGIISVLIARETKVNKARGDTVLVDRKNQTTAMKEGLAEYALIPNAYWTDAL